MKPNVTDCRFRGLRKEDCLAKDSVPLSTRVGTLVALLESFKTKYDDQFAEAQETLRNYVTCPEYPLEERFEVWSKWCKKVDHPWVINEQKAGVFGKAVEDRAYDFDRYRKYDWEDMLDLFVEGWLMRKQFDMTEEEVKEALIDTNFGSFYMDW